jgi:hypothetical protein
MKGRMMMTRTSHATRPKTIKWVVEGARMTARETSIAHLVVVTVQQESALRECLVGEKMQWM